MTKFALPALLLLGLACSSGTRLPRAPRGQEVLQVRGSLKGAPFRLGEADLASLKQEKVKGMAPGGAGEATYQGVDLAALLDRLDLSGGADTMVVRTADDQAVPVPLPVVRELRPVLADRADGASLGARLVAWPNRAQHGLQSDPRASLWWARTVVALEFVSWARVYGRALSIPEGAPAGALAGEGVFGERCMACHRIRQAGGTNGPELARDGRSPSREKLAAILPAHPGWSSPGAAPPRPEVVSQLAAYLWTVARTPSEDAAALQPEPPPQPPPLSPGPFLP
jgi:hypothetical protein